MASKLIALGERRAEIQKQLDGLEKVRDARGESERFFTAEEGTSYDALLGDLKTVNADARRHTERQAAENADWLDRRGLKGPGELADGAKATIDDGARIEVGEGPRFASLGEQLQAVAYASTPGARMDDRLRATVSGASANVGADGGFLIQKDFVADLYKMAFETGVLASRCSTTDISGNSDGLEVVYIDETSRATGSRWGGVQVYRVAEADTVTATKAKIAKWECRLEDMMGLAYMTERLIQDAPAMGQVFREAFTEEFAFKLDDEILRGTGAGQCLGILNSGATVSVAKETGQDADSVVAENIQKMWKSVPASSRTRGVWVYNQELENSLQNMQIGTGSSAQLVYMPPGGLSGSQYGTIYGRPVLAIEHASGAGDVGDIAFLDLSMYKLIRKAGIQADESIHVRFINNERTFRWVARVNGAPKIKSAITPYKRTDSNFKLSPFVTLAAR